MSEEKKSTIGFSLFFLFIILMVITGFFLLTYEKPSDKEKINNTAIKMKKDQDKDFIYYEGIEALSVEQSLIYKYPVINFDNDVVNELNKKFKADLNLIKKDVVKLDSVSEEQKATAIYTDDNIYSAKIRDYEIIEYNEYITLLIKDYTYICTGENSNPLYTAYIFLKTKGEYLTTTDYLKNNNRLFTDVTTSIRNKLEKEQVIKEDNTALIDIEATINELYNSAVIYPNDNGKIKILFVVKSSENNYNDSIEID